MTIETQRSLPIVGAAASALREATGVANGLVVTTFAPAERVGRGVRIERKTRDGLEQFAANLACRVTLIATKLRTDSAPLFDPVVVEDRDPAIAVVVIDPYVGHGHAQWTELRDILQKAALVYGMGPVVIAAAIELGCPVIPVVENTLANTIRIARYSSGGFLRRLHRILAALANQRPEQKRLAQAAVIHAVGHVVYESLVGRYDVELYLDSRVRRQQIVSLPALEKRYETLKHGRPLRLLTFGRLEPLKGPMKLLDAVVRVARSRVAITLDVYGDGSLREPMQQHIAREQLSSSIRMRGTVPFTELMELAKEYDLFLAGNVQDDPSCAYLEAMGAGLPVVAFGNRAWRTLCCASGGGIVVDTMTSRAMAEAIGRLATRPGEIECMALSARTFAVRHCFEEEFARRTESIRRVMSSTEGRPRKV